MEPNSSSVKSPEIQPSAISRILDSTVFSWVVGALAIAGGIVLILLAVLDVQSKAWLRAAFTGFIGFGFVLYTVRALYRQHREERRFRQVESLVQQIQDRAWSPQVEAELMQLRKVMPDVSESSHISVGPGIQKMYESLDASDSGTIYLRGLELANIRCFEHFALGLEGEDGPYLTTILLGDNAAGKTTILRSIGLGLCPESDAISLMTGLSGSFLRKGAEQGSISLHVRSADRKFSGVIRTTIEQGPGRSEIIRQVTEPSNFPWSRILVCGYGTHRSSGRPSSHESYVAREAVGTLFSDAADLLNPEVVLLRRDTETRRRLELILKQILLLDDSEAGIRTTDRGIELGGPWGTQPISAVSDGYRSTSQWVLDYLGWQLFADRIQSGTIEGVLLIDELEQHLHPRWQRYFVQRLRSQLGQTQIVASSHTPLLAAGVADVPRSQVVRLVPTRDGSVTAIKIPLEELTGKRADQILADAFGLITSKSPGSMAKIDRYTELLSRKPQNQSEQQELATLKKELEDAWSSGDHELKRKAEKAVSKVLDEMIQEGSQREILDAQVKEHLLDLFGGKESEGAKK